MSRKKAARMFWHPTEQGWFDEATHGAEYCATLTPVKMADYARLMAAHRQGKAIVTGKGGLPVLVDQADVPVDEETRIARRRADRDRRLRASDWTQAMDTLLGNPALKTAWALYRQALRDLDMTGTDWPAEPAAESFPVPKIEGGQP